MSDLECDRRDGFAMGETRLDKLEQLGNRCCGMTLAVASRVDDK